MGAEKIRNALYRMQCPIKGCDARIQVAAATPADAEMIAKLRGWADVVVRWTTGQLHLSQHGHSHHSFVCPSCANMLLGVEKTEDRGKVIE